MIANRRFFKKPATNTFHLWVEGPCCKSRSRFLFSLLIVRQMDMSDIGVRHVVGVPEIHIRHTIDVSPIVASIARDIRYTVIAIVFGITGVSIANIFLASRRSTKT